MGLSLYRPNGDVLESFSPHSRGVLISTIYPTGQESLMLGLRSSTDDGVGVAVLSFAGVPLLDVNSFNEFITEYMDTLFDENSLPPLQGTLDLSTLPGVTMTLDRSFTGTDQNDTLDGRAGDDTITDLDGGDRITGGRSDVRDILNSVTLLNVSSLDGLGATILMGHVDPEEELLFDWSYSQDDLWI